MRCYDANIHFLFHHPVDELGDSFEYLEKIGRSGFVAIFSVEYPPDMQTIQKLNPVGYHGEFKPEIQVNKKDPFPLFTQ